MSDRLDNEMLRRGLAQSRSQAENYIKLGYVRVDGQECAKPHKRVGSDTKITLKLKERYVSRAALKLDSVAEKLDLDFKDKVVLDVGSSTGGFSDYALQHGAEKVYAVDVGTDQLHPSLRGDERIELHEKTDIRSVKELAQRPDLVLIDVSFISMREILPAASKLSKPSTQIVAMLKPQFEAGEKDINKGVVKNSKVRRDIFKSFEQWVRKDFIIEAKADSQVHGAKGNQERFYLLKKVS